MLDFDVRKVLHLKATLRWVAGKVLPERGVNVPWLCAMSLNQV
jgi:hypothetical protein